MKRFGAHRLLSLNRLAVVLAGGLLPLSFSGCDPEVRDTVLNGVQSALVGLTTSVLNALFMAISSSATGGGSSQTQTVMHDAFNAVSSFFA